MTPQQPMDHAAAHERIEDLLIEPARLATIETSTAPEDAALREHLAGCPTCANDLEAWRRLQRAVGDALPTDPSAAAAAIEPIDLPVSLRARTLAATRTGDQPAAPIRIAPVPRARRLAPWLSLAASITILAGAGLLAVDQIERRAAAEAGARELAAAIAVVDRMLATEHKVVELRTVAGLPAGTISWSRHDWVVLTGALAEPAADQAYLCWLETDGRSVPIGHMEFAGATGYWVASLDEWQTWEIGPTTRFVVTLEAAGAQQRAGEAILEARLAT